jgi:hypothetical protein
MVRLFRQAHLPDQPYQPRNDVPFYIGDTVAERSRGLEITNSDSSFSQNSLKLCSCHCRITECPQSLLFLYMSDKYNNIKGILDLGR